MVRLKLTRVAGYIPTLADPGVATVALRVGEVERRKRQSSRGAQGAEEMGVILSTLIRYGEGALQHRKMPKGGTEVSKVNVIEKCNERCTAKLSSKAAGFDKKSQSSATSAFSNVA